MSRRLSLLALAAATFVLALAVTGPASAAPGSFVRCADGIAEAGVEHLGAKNVSCRAAAKVVDHFILVAHAEDDGYKGWTCVNSHHPQRPTQNKCTRRHHGTKQKIRFLFEG